MNAPERSELFVLAEGQKKVTIKQDTKMPNTSTFIIEKEDHTLGNLLASHIQRSPHCRFAGYKVPHPLEHNFILKIQTDDSTTPTQLLQDTNNELIRGVSALEQAFKNDLRKYI